MVGTTFTSGFLHGQYLSVVVARKVSESVLASAVLTQLREHKWEVDELAAEYVRRNPNSLPKGANMNADEVKAAKVQALAKHMIDFVRDFHVVPTDSEDAQTMQSQAQLQTFRPNYPKSEPKVLDLVIPQAWRSLHLSVASFRQNVFACC